MSAEVQNDSFVIDVSKFDDLYSDAENDLHSEVLIEPLLDDYSNGSQKLAPHWIEQTFCKRECGQFIPSSKEPTKCGCGRVKSAHAASALPTGLDYSYSNAYGVEPERWTISKHTASLPTDAFGTIEFQGGPHPHKAQYVRLGFDSDPDDILRLFQNIWGIKAPKLVITVHGGIANFGLQPKLTRVFRKGLLKAAKTAGAWIITSGINAGVVRHVAAALSDGGNARSRSKVVTIGIAPWGLLKKRDHLVGADCTVSYHPHAFSPKGKLAILNDKHSYFLLVDNGTVGRYGADIILRKRFEEHISKQLIGSVQRGAKRKRIPVVCVVLEGGTCTIRAVLDYVTNIPPVPVVVCDGSGRAADLLAFIHQYVLPDGTLPEEMKPQVLCLVQEVFGYNKAQADKVILELLLCVRKQHLITVFKLGEDLQQDIDHSILTALLRGQGDLSAPDQLSLTLAWNRVDIARSDIFVLGQEWPKGSLDTAMMEALVEDRVDFVKLLLENGVSMEKFLTLQRLEDLYNAVGGDKGSQANVSTKYTTKDVTLQMPHSHRYTLKDIGITVEKLMGSGYCSTYCGRELKQKYKLRKAQEAVRQQYAGRGFSLHKHGITVDQCSNYSLYYSLRKPFIDTDKTDKGGDLYGVAGTSSVQDPDFKNPFNELFIWAVLTNRQEMARCMWQHGEEALPKALVACKLYKSLANEAGDDYLELEVCDELRRNAEEFRKLSLELLENCYGADEGLTARLLTYELKNWGRQTSLSLAVIANNKEFLAHPCCQILLADLWHGGMRIRSNSNWKVLSGLLCPLYILRLEFKTKEELMLQPKTAEEHAEEVRDGCDSGVGMGSQISSEAESDYETDSSDDPESGAPRRRRRAHSLSERLTHKLSRAPSMASLASTAINKLKIKRFPQPETPGGAGSHLHVGGTGLPTVVSARSEGASPRFAARIVAPMRQSLERLTHNTTPHIRFPTPGRFSSVSSPGMKRTTGSMQTPITFKQERGKMPSMPNVMDSSGASTLLVGESVSKALTVRKKFYEFYVAPITTFWSFALSYVAFLVVYTYVALVKTPPTVMGAEIFLLLYVLSLSVEQLRKIMMSDPVGFKQKLRVFCERGWNWTTTLAIFMFFIGFLLRKFPETIAWGHVFYGSNIIFWYLRILDILSINSKLGPYITMVGKMVLKMVYIITILTVVLMSFGVAHQSIRFPNEDWHWQLVRNIFFHPYFMLYGEVYAPEIDTCGDSGEGCVPGGWLTPIYMAAFLVVANILLINLLIAVFNHIFQETNAVAHQMWRFQRYEQVMEFESTPFLPPPLVLLCDAYLLFKYCCRRKSRRTFDYSLKLFLSEEDIEKLSDFEEECMDDLAREKEYQTLISTEERIKKTADRTEFISMKVTDIMAKESSTKTLLTDLENRLEEMETIQRTITNRQTEQLSLLRQILATLGKPQQKSTLKPLPILLPRLPPWDDNKPVQKPVKPVSETGAPQTAFPITNKLGGTVREKLRLQRSSGSGKKFSVPHLTISPPTDDELNSSSDVLSPNLIHNRQYRKRTLAQQTDRHPQRLNALMSDNITNGATRKLGPMDKRSLSVPAPAEGQMLSLMKTPLLTLQSFPISRQKSVTTARQMQRRNSEYTSITDAILVRDSQINDAASALCDTAVLDSETKKKHRLSSSSSTGKPDKCVNSGFVNDAPIKNDALMCHAKPSFALSQNEMLKEFEETGSRITGGLLERRMRLESSICVTDAEDLKDMGLSDLDIRDSMEPASNSSSCESLNSGRIEDEEGFLQITECLIQQELGRVANSTGTTPLDSFCTPLTSPGSKAGQMFTFDADDLHEYLSKVQIEEQQKRCSLLSEDE